MTALYVLVLGFSPVSSIISVKSSRAFVAMTPMSLSESDFSLSFFCRAATTAPSFVMHISIRMLYVTTLGLMPCP